MFKRFHDHVEGSGIGLFMVKRIIENARGKITLQSEEGSGSEFKVYFKAAIPHQESVSKLAGNSFSP